MLEFMHDFIGLTNWTQVISFFISLPIFVTSPIWFEPLLDLISDTIHKN